MRFEHEPSAHRQWNEPYDASEILPSFIMFIAMLEFNLNKNVTGNNGNDIEVAYSSVLLSVVSISGSNSKCVCVSNQCKSPIFKYQMFIEQLYKCLPYLKFQWYIRCVALQCTHVHSIGPFSKHLDGMFESITWHLWFDHFFSFVRSISTFVYFGIFTYIFQCTGPTGRTTDSERVLLHSTQMFYVFLFSVHQYESR